MGMNMNSHFTSALLENLRTTIRRLKAEGTVAMGIENLRQVCPTPSSNLKGAPKGTNAQYFYARLFEDVVEENEDVARFILPPRKESTEHPGWVGQRGGMVASPGQCPR
jgi:hypothetical protein